MAGNTRAIPFSRIQVEARNQETNKYSKREWLLQMRETVHHINVPAACNAESTSDVQQGVQGRSSCFAVEDDSGRVARIHRGACEEEADGDPICSGSRV